MEDLIRQAFLNVDILGPHVFEGHYDLLGPNGDIILPQVWENIVESGWTITMHMWPMPEPPDAVSDNLPLVSPLSIKLPTPLPQFLPPSPPSSIRTQSNRRRPGPVPLSIPQATRWRTKRDHPRALRRPKKNQPTLKCSRTCDEAASPETVQSLPDITGIVEPTGLTA